ncbi:Protein of unknown function [Pyronema omphalodes CBS 100304]|uniref:Uncharacterized protein n=1 Tax=Pyronema omphalodes (strain CBS 100304) TaxID=1076935 RepID=U4LPX2_PYROM|nr:Protein of unknown function [Pyronema omphalodes CBS 100304]
MHKRVGKTLALVMNLRGITDTYY